MGRSKFPGKPSKLVTKKRVSVLNGSSGSSSGTTSGNTNKTTSASTSSASTSGASHTSTATANTSSAGGSTTNNSSSTSSSSTSSNSAGQQKGQPQQRGGGGSKNALQSDCSESTPTTATSADEDCAGDHTVTAVSGKDIKDGTKLVVAALSSSLVITTSKATSSKTTTSTTTTTTTTTTSTAKTSKTITDEKDIIGGTTKPNKSHCGKVVTNKSDNSDTSHNKTAALTLTSVDIKSSEKAAKTTDKVNTGNNRKEASSDVGKSTAAGDKHLHHNNNEEDLKKPPAETTMNASTVGNNEARCDSSQQQQQQQQKSTSTSGIFTRTRTSTTQPSTATTNQPSTSAKSALVIPPPMLSTEPPPPAPDDPPQKGGAALKKAATKKKTVTFKSVLEVSDDVNVVKKVYNPDGTPSASIIKKESLSRAVRYAKGIVRPSRLTEILKNNANKIDKLGSLTFKSSILTPIGGNSSTFECHGAALAHSSSGEASSSVGNAGDADDVADNNVISTDVGDKRFVLPKRSAHSCRVIKPNKRFLNDLDDSHSKNGKKSSSRKGGDKKCSSIGNEKEDDDGGYSNKSSEASKCRLNGSEDDINNDCDNAQGSQTDGSSDSGSEAESSSIRSNPQEASGGPFSQRGLFCNTPATSKVILRQPRLQFTTSNTSKEGPFSLNLNSTNKTNLESSECGVCGTVASSKFTQKFGINSCEACRKFISKSVKKLAASSSISAPSMAFQCRNDCSCQIVPLSKGNRFKVLKSTMKERCHACWLKKCVKTFLIPSGLRSRIIGLLPPTMRDLDSGLSSTFSIKKELLSESSSTNIFSVVQNAKLLTWPQPSTDSGDIDLMASKLKSLSNPLSENNKTFGSTPLLKPPSLIEKPIMLESAKVSDLKIPSVAVPSTNIKQPTENSDATATITQSTQQQQPTSVIPPPPPAEVEELSRMRLRKAKDRDAPPTTTAPPPTPLSVTTVTAEQPKRQRIDLKGPRVKHVCRSASIVLGQPAATFPLEASPLLETMDTPPRPDSPQETEMQLRQSTAIKEVQQQQQLNASMCTDCTQDLALSPPATPIENQEDDADSNSLELKGLTTTKPEPQSKVTKSNLGIVPTTTTATPDVIVTTSSIVLATTMTVTTASTTITTIADTAVNLGTQKIEEILKPNTRERKRPNCVPSSSTVLSSKQLNAFSRKPIPPKVKSPLISIDFWENYDPAEVSQTGFGLIVSEGVPVRALCFLCGSYGQGPLIFCVCCCEPYHQYCVEDEYNLKHSSMLDETNSSIFDVTLTAGVSGIGGSNQITNQLNWLCPRCTVCYSCNMASGSKVKCQKCQKNYHSTCLGTSKRLSGADRPLICAHCLKCKSCGTTNVSKFVGNLPMCSSCFKLRQKGNFCPLCQKCYEENDFNLKMMECGDCRRWVHAKCEGLTDEQYNMLSVLPESIEFICVKCARCNSVADTWREAVSAEFKSGLLSVVRQLSKSRQACVLLKLSPRKKTVGCICQPMQSNRTIQFLKSENITAMGGAADMEDEESLKSDDITMGSGSGSTTGSEAFSNVDNKRYPMKCYCGATQKQVMDTVPSLLDIRRKISDNGYFSLGDFNYDMNLVINAASCDDLMTAYKEILSEAFPWFQNETKACTDALEEDMYDSCSFGHNSPTMESDQQVPMINIPDEIDDYFYTSYDKVDTRFCMFCKGIGEGVPQHEDRLLYCGQNSWVHTNCALWSAEVFEEIDGSLQNVHMAISRGRLIKCTKCGIKGATVGCNAKNCGEHFHYPCARKAGCSFLVDKTVYCVQHLHEAGRKQCCKEKNFEVLRPVYVELDRRKKKFAEPSRVQFLIGSLQVKKLGRIVAALSDNTDALVPADYQCSRLYWSSKEPWKVVEYTVRTFVQTNNITCNGDFGRNFTVDHTNNINLVALGLAQIAKWHGSLSGEETDFNTYRTERSLKHIIEVIGSGNGDETNEEEPQNNADLLPPEIKDAIFEDLPHDILDGISMLDIFPKLMTYEDMVAMDAKNEVYLNSEMMRENMCDDDLSQKDYEVDVWPTTSSGPTHVEDQLLSAVRPTMSRELKRSKSEIFPRGVAASRSHQRSSSLTWSCKLDVTAAAKRRKVARNGFSVLQDMRLPEGVLLSLSRRKEDFPSSVLDKRRSSIQAVDDIKTKTFTWSASKRLNQIDETTDTSTTNASHQPDSFDKLKISQLDGGIDEASSSSEGGNSPMHKFGNHFDSPVKCDRCHCSYRTQDSYQRHLTTCEPLSTSESESEATPRSPDMQTQQTQQSCNVYVATSMPMVQDMCNMPIFSQQQQPQHQQNSLSSILNNNAFTSQNINHINQLVQNQLAGLQGMGCQTQQYNPNLQQSLQAQIQNSMHGTNVQNAGIPITHLNQSNMLLAQSQSNTQQQMFAQPINVNLQSQLFPLQNITTQTTTNINQYSTNTSALDHLTQNNMLQSKGVQQQRINTNQHMPLSLQSASNQQYNQPQLIQISSGSNPQIMTLTTAPTHNLNTIRQIQPQQQQNLQQSQTSPHKNQLILPQPDKMFNKKHSLPRIQQSPVNRGKGKVPVKATPVKRTIVKNEQKPVQIINQNVPIMRSVNQTDGIVIQQSPSNQQMLMQQLSSPQTNLMSYMTADGNTMQYIAMPTAQEYKPAQPQYLTSNQLMPGTFQLQQDASGNFVLANTPALQVLPGGTLQLAQPQQPQVIGTLIQPQGLQCGMMSAEQMMLGSTPTLEVVATNPSQGCMLLTNQPVYYGLETIVQNTVMSSQQFVSTAMQGVLSQNSSFSATTTQVFQASKIEPILEVPTGYVVLNNVGDNQMQLQHATSQPNILSANVLQSAVPQIQQTPTNQIQPQTTWRFIDDNGAMQTATVSSAAANSIHMTTHQMHTVSTPKATITTKTPTVMPKMTSQIQISKTTTTPSNTNNHMVTNNNLLRPIMNSIESQEVTMSNMPPPKSVASTMEVISAMTGMHATSAVSTSSLTITPTSTSLMSNHHQPKPSTITSSSSSSITVTAPCAATTPPVNVTQSPLQMSIQPIQRKTNMIRPITNGSKSSITVKPKVIGKPVAAKSQKAQSKMGATHLVPTTAPVTIQSYLHTEPETLLTENLNVLHKSQMLDAKFSSIEISYKVEEPTVTSVPSSSSASNDIVNFQSSITTNASQSSVSSKTATTNCAILSISIPNQSNLSTQANTLLQAVPQMQQIGGINLPTSASIQLPSAPYATPYSNGIPTNVVNPIQQNNSRPMNRVLPMQTVQQKASPPTPPEPKVLSESGHDIKFQDITNETTKIEQSLSASDMTSSPIIVITTDKSMSSPMSSTNDQAHSDVPTEDEFDSGKFDAMDFMDQDDSLPAFDKLKAESNGMMDREDDRTSPEVKKKICAILVNLENDDCGSGKHMMDTSPCGSSTASPFRLSVSTEVEPINNNVVMAEHRITKEEEKENSIQQITEELLMKLQKPITTVVTPKPSSESIAQLQKPNTPSILFEIQSQDGFSYKSSSITEIWEKVFESVQMARKAHGLSQLPEGPLADMCGYQMLGLKTNALKYLLEQLPGAERCTKYTPRYHKRPLSIASHSGSSGYLSDLDDYKENIKGAVRCEAYVSRSEYDMFSWLASRHRKQPVQIVVQSESEIAPRRGSGSNLPMAMRYRTLKETYKESVGVYRSHIHGRGLFCIKDIEAGEMVIEYAGELIRSTLTDKRERYYDGKGIGCYMFKIDDNLVVDATMRGNAARFINHSCEPNCYSKVVDILGHKHIIIFALRRIVQGEELTYDYKFPFEDVKIPCSCGSKRCRKYLN